MHRRRALPATATVLLAHLALPAPAAAAVRDLPAWWLWIVVGILVLTLVLGLFLLLRMRREQGVQEWALPPLIVPAGMSAQGRVPGQLESARTGTVGHAERSGTPSTATPAPPAKAAIATHDRLPALQSPASSPTGAAGSAARFEVVRGAGIAPINLDIPPNEREIITLGRSATATGRHIRLNAPTVSRLHAALHCREGRWHLENRSHTNPVLLNGEPMSDGGVPVLLKDGDTLELGEVALRFRAS
jgi:hypothetical protein